MGKKELTWGELLIGKKEHKKQMKRVKQWEKEIKREEKKPKRSPR